MGGTETSASMKTSTSPAAWHAPMLRNREVPRTGACVELQPQVLVGIQGASDANHGLRKLCVDAPVPALEALPRE